MDAGMTFTWMDIRRAAMAQTRHTGTQQADRLVRDNIRLAEENERLKRQCADLRASAELWARLYEAALERAGDPPGRGRRGP